MSLSLKVSNILGAGLASWKIKATNASTNAVDTGYYELPKPYEGKFIDKTLSQLDAKGREVAHALDFAYDAKFMVSNRTNLIKMIPAIIRNPTDHKLLFQNGRTGSSENLHTKGMGTNFKLVFDSDMENMRYFQMIADRKVLLQPITLVGTIATDTATHIISGTNTKFLTALRTGDIIRTSDGQTITIGTIATDISITGCTGESASTSGLTVYINDWTNFLISPPADGSQTMTTDVLYPSATQSLNLLTAGDVYSGGVNKVWTREKSVADPTWTHEFGKVNKFKMTVEGLGERDQEGRTFCNRAKFNVSFDMMQTVSTEELVDIQTICRQENDFRIEFVDGLILNLSEPSNIGIDIELHNDTDATGNQFITVKGSGIVSLLGTTFADLWS